MYVNNPGKSENLEIKITRMMRDILQNDYTLAFQNYINRLD